MIIDFNENLTPFKNFMKDQINEFLIEFDDYYHFQNLYFHDDEIVAYELESKSPHIAKFKIFKCPEDGGFITFEIEENYDSERLGDRITIFIDDRDFSSIFFNGNTYLNLNELYDILENRVFTTNYGDYDYHE